MTTTRLPADAALLTGAARLADLPLPEGRAAELLPAADMVFQLLEGLSPEALGNTPPAAAYNAQWAPPQEQDHG